MTHGHKRFRCAIYTRKSSEEGLEQAFNSLDAQREACLAYVQSQRHEGWRALDAHYDDGGYSGGSLERPGLQALLGEINAGKVDVVVVYKVDRLTRSLADFAKIVELFDAHGVSFVSVTQQFNTTTSMGRLTLNVLLSFAQFEREVTGERIRDKIAASKKKGMWMGGHVPLGYDLKERKLIINTEEAELVCRIYRRYLELGCVRKLQIELRTTGVVSKRRMSRSGSKSGGCPYSRGALYAILQNRLYIGEVAHRGAAHQGEQAPIIGRDLWQQVQGRLQANGQARRNGLRVAAPSLLAGILFDAEGHRLTPLHSTKNAKRYRYYTSQAVIRNGPALDGGITRIPANDIEQLVIRRLCSFLRSSREVQQSVCVANEPASIQRTLIESAVKQAAMLSKAPATEVRSFLCATVLKISLLESDVAIRLTKRKLRAVLLAEPENISSLAAPNPPPESDRDEIVLSVAATLKRLGGAVRIIISPDDAVDTPSVVNHVLVKALARAQRWYKALAAGEIESLQALAKVTKLNERYVSRVLRCAFLAPDIVQKVLEGTQPQSLTLDSLLRDIPVGWDQQRHLFKTSRTL
jgi:site-specific DNA recombinase